MSLWKVFGVSDDMNSFGLYGVRLMDKKGRFYEVGASSFCCPMIGDEIEVIDDHNGFPMLGNRFEIPERKFPDAPQDVIDAVWEIKGGDAPC